eukprot:3497650-Pyramimonas_sp.AAC.1
MPPTPQRGQPAFDARQNYCFAHVHSDTVSARLRLQINKHYCRLYGRGCHKQHIVNKPKIGEGSPALTMTMP